MSSEQEIAIISLGSKMSPFLSEIIKQGTIATSYITNNATDFSIHHADPSKELDYFLEFTNILEQKAKQGIDSLSVFETLGQFFEFYNPLHLSTVNYLLSKFATNMKDKEKTYSEIWNSITEAIFEDEFVYPLFEDPKIIHVKEGEVEIPVRQLILKYEIQNQEKKNEKLTEEKLEDITGIIDLEKMKKVKLNNEAIRRIEDAYGVIIVPTDIISLFIVFQSQNFKDLLRKTSGEIVILSPLYNDKEICKVEELILKKTEFDPSLLNIVQYIDDYVDTVIIDKKNSELVSKLRESGITVLVDDLSKENQKTPEFLDLVLKSIDIDPEVVKREPSELKEGFGEKILHILSSRLSKPMEQEPDELDEIESATERIKNQDEQATMGDSGKDEIRLTEATKALESKETIKDSSHIVTDDEINKLAEIIQENDNIASEFEMDIKDDDENDISQTLIEDQDSSLDVVETKTSPSKDVIFSLPSIDDITKLEWKDFESFEADEQIISAYIDRALHTNDIGVEIAFSDLLSLQNNDLLVEKIYKLLMTRLITIIEKGIDKKLANIITFLAAHKPGFYVDKFKEMMEETINWEIHAGFDKRLNTVAIVIGNSFPVGEEVIKDFFKKYIKEDDVYIQEKLRIILRELYSKTKKSKKLIARTLLESLLEQARQGTEQRVTITHRMAVFLSMLDAHIIGLEAIQVFPVEDFNLLYDIFSSKVFADSYSQICKDILKAFEETNLERLRTVLHGLSIPRDIQSLLIKQSYRRSLSKVGSIPLDIFAEQSGLSTEKAEKLIYEMILKGEIKARIELVNERLYIVQEKEEKPEELEKKKLDFDEVSKEKSAIIDEEISAIKEIKELDTDRKKEEKEPEIRKSETKESEETKEIPKPEESEVEMSEKLKKEPEEPEEKSSKEKETLEIDVLTGMGQKAEILKAIGFDTLEKIANADPEELTVVKGIGKKTAISFIQEAKELQKKKHSD